MNNLFETAKPQSELHPNFASLRDSTFHGEVRNEMNRIFQAMGDPNGRFLQHFASNGFHAGVFELAAYAYLESSGFSIDRSHECPDFMATKMKETLAIEATTANPPDGVEQDISATKILPISPDELATKCKDEFPRRIISLLTKKLRKRYDKMTHCAGKPLVLFVSPLFEPGSVFYTDEDLIESFYGDESGSGSIEPFFNREHAAQVSAVLFSNQFTVPKFFRMASRNLRYGLRGMREGYCLRNLDEEHFSIEPYKYWLGGANAPLESWDQGVTLFLNPNAKIALDPSILPHTSMVYVDETGFVRRDVADFHPVTSFMTLYSNPA